MPPAPTPPGEDLVAPVVNCLRGRTRESRGYLHMVQDWWGRGPRAA